MTTAYEPRDGEQEAALNRLQHSAVARVDKYYGKGGGSGVDPKDLLDLELVNMQGSHDNLHWYKNMYNLVN